jgi:hypothetical protein
VRKKNYKIIWGSWLQMSGRAYKLESNIKIDLKKFGAKIQNTIVKI